MTITNKVSLKSVMAGNTPISDVPDAPTIGAVTAGTELVTVAYTAAATGGTVTTFTATSTPGSLTGTGASPITVSGLTGDTAYTFKVKGTNAISVIGPESAASGSATPTVATSFESIATTTVSTATASVTFSGIPATYTHLQIRGITKGSGTANIAVNGLFKINSDTGNNYSRHLLDGNGSSATSTGSASQSSIVFCPVPDSGVSGSGSMFGVFVMDILDYTNTNKYKTVRSFSGYDLNDATYGSLRHYYGLWMNTNAITSITFTPDGINLAQYSSFALYGIKG